MLQLQDVTPNKTGEVKKKQVREVRLHTFGESGVFTHVWQVVCA